MLRLSAKLYPIRLALLATVSENGFNRTRKLSDVIVSVKFTNSVIKSNDLWYYIFISVKTMRTDYGQEQEMEIEALEAILMDGFKEIHSSESGLNTSNRCFQITIVPQFSLLSFSHIRGFTIKCEKHTRHTEVADLRILIGKLEQKASENLGMAMVYTLVTSAKDWLSEKYGQDASNEEIEDEKVAKDDIIVPHGEPVTVDTFLAWRERFEAEMALERAKLMPESALTAPKEKKLTGRQWFESGRAKSATAVNEGSDEEDEEEIDFDDDDFEDDEEDMLKHYLAEKSDSSSYSSRRPN